MTDDPWLDRMGDALDRADTLEKGTYFEGFAEGETIEHAPGLRLSRDGSELWASATLNHDPAYWRADAAAERGFDGPPIHPDYLLACTMGPSVEDLSEKGGYFLGRTGVRYHRDAVYPGTELRVESRVVETRPSSSRPAYGIVTWETTGFDAADEPLCSYERTNMVPRREPVETDGGGSSRNESGRRSDPDLPTELLSPDGPFFEDFRDALDRAEGRDAAVAYRHERGRTIDDVLISVLPLRTLNTAKQHHDADAMADSPSGEIVAYGDVTRSIALGHARSDEATRREIGCDDERFHGFVTRGDTIYGFTRVVSAEEGEGDAGRVTFEHYAVNQRDEPVYSGTRTALVRRR
ncbi:2-methylfumaryl-CoA hydratase [Halegenticoccus tardaugens]|uniref:2-methylfumaryl-CoA hydratase n=1 Tax=Halegenticoccus tardaugens TaxID=2071624 RepID=UPI00100B7A2B|nr:2-methylfumaryl-CoA hydratase [Halegenticoccus tardaugens]